MTYDLHDTLVGLEKESWKNLLDIAINTAKINRIDAKKQYPWNPKHPIGTCADCGKEMVYNVPRMGPDGGFVHKDTGSLTCGPYVPPTVGVYDNAKEQS
jgi:hypothetical protein